MTTTRFSGDAYISMDDVRSAIDELEDVQTEAEEFEEPADPFTGEMEDEELVRNVPDYVEGLIREDELSDHLRQEWHDLYDWDVDRLDLPPYCHIEVDYDEMENDYSSVYFDGDTYYYRD